MIGVLMMAYGGPDRLADVEPYLLDVRGHRPTPPDVVHEVRERYRAIGGRSPILENTEAQARALEAALNDGPEGGQFKVFVGMRHWHPFIDDALAHMAAEGVARAVGLVMAPHYSRLSIGAYFGKTAEARAPIDLAPIHRWHLLPGYLDALAVRIRAALEKFPAEARASVPIIYTAHSLPRRILEWDDPYPVELRATVAGLMERLAPPASPNGRHALALEAGPGLTGQAEPLWRSEDGRHIFAYQSAALTPDPWLGPDAGEVIASLAAAGRKHVLVVPIGFVCEHVEILYDVDIVFKQQAEGLGMQLERIEMLNAAPPMMAGLAGLVRQTAKEAGWL